MTLVRVTTGDDGGSRFEDVDLDAMLRPAAISAPLPVREARLRRTVREASGNLHRPSAPMLVITLAGTATVTCGDGAERTFGPGDILWADDVEGEGHRTVEVSEDRVSLVVHLGPGADLRGWLHAASQ